NIAAGALQIGNNTPSGSAGTGPVTNSGNLYFLRSDASTFSNTLTGNGLVAQLKSSGQLTFTGSKQMGSLYVGSESVDRPLIFADGAEINVAGYINLGHDLFGTVGAIVINDATVF